MLLGENSDTIHKLFSIDVQYEVPRYQRRYVWNETNWHALWEDILSQLEGPEFGNDSKGHFTGNIVTNPISTGRLSRFEVIDGQQRLTTFQIIFCVIRDICKSKNYDDLVEESEKHLINSDNTIKSVNRQNSEASVPDPTYKFLPTDYDKSAFKAVVRGDYRDKKVQEFAEVEKFSQNIINAYDFFNRVITSYIEEDCDENRVTDLITSIKADFNLIHITLATSDQPEKIFESLNATGRMLSEFDYLRNNLFLRAGELSDVFYEDYWLFESDSHFWDTDRLELFLRAFLIAKLGPEIEGKPLKAFDLYKDYIRTLTIEQQRVEYEFEQLKLYADSYREMSDSNSQIGGQMQFYDHLHIPRLDTFILFLKHSWGLGDNELITVCQILESYIVRQMICYRNWQACYEKIHESFVQAMNTKAHNIDEIKNVLFDKLEFRGEQEIINAFKSAGSKDDNLILYILYRIESKNRKVLLEFSCLDLLQIEHKVLPESPDEEGVRYWIERDSIGNITLCTSGTPDGWSDFSFSEKKVALENEVAPDLFLTKGVCKFEKWSANEIDDRTDELYDLFCEIWDKYA